MGGNSINKPHTICANTIKNNITLGQFVEEAGWAQPTYFPTRDSYNEQ